MTIELAISSIAILVAIASALYARHAVTEAKNANRISSHQHKLEILEAVRDFKHIFQVSGEAIDASLVYSLLGAAGKASLYFTKPVADHLSRYAASAYDMLIARDGAKRLESVQKEVPREKWEQIFSRVDDCRKIEGDLLAQLETQTKIVD